MHTVQFPGERIIVTGHTGFKGAWLCAWLKSIGATVAGLALEPDRGPGDNLFDAADIGSGMESTIADIRDLDAVQRAFQEFSPTLVFHLAAQPLVRRSYCDPLGTFSTNVMGTAHVLEAARRCGSVRAIVCVTTDKVYDNKEWVYRYRENDPLGGHDPYSASKAAAELVAGTYARALYPLDHHPIALATARGGNVVGGGDWSEDRIIPDVVRFINRGDPIILRNPSAIRPWQHVLELVSGYLVLGRFLLDRPKEGIGAWNFGPDRDNEVDVERLARDFAALYGKGDSQIEIIPSKLVEANFLKLDITRATTLLPWRPRLDFARTIEWTAAWYYGFHRQGRPAKELMAEQIEAFAELAQ